MSKNHQQQSSQLATLKCKNCLSNRQAQNPVQNCQSHNDDSSNPDHVNTQPTGNTNNQAFNTNNDSSMSNIDSNDNISSQNTNTVNNKKNLSRNACIIERLNFLYLNESLSDINFLFGKKQTNNVSIESEEANSSIIRIPAHKLVLSIGSQVFMAMFYGTGSQMLPTSEIEIPDVDPESFKNMLHYLYTDELHVEPDSVMSTLYVAKKYAIGALEIGCVDFLKNNLRADNAFMLLEQALLFDEVKLSELCLNVIDKNSCEAFSSDCFLDTELDTLVLVLKRDTLGIREFKLYYYILKWAQNQCVKLNLLPINRENQKLVLGEAIKLVRFPLMTKEEFAIAMNDFDSRIIDDESIIDLFVNLTLSNNGVNTVASNSNSAFMPKKLMFNDTPRCCLEGKEQVINRFSQVESRWGYSGTSDRVRFTVSQRIFVIGFGLYGSIYGKCEYQAIIQLIHYDSCTTCAQNSTTFTCDGTNSTFRVYFKEPVELFSDTDYIASATLKGPDSFYGTKGIRKVCHEIPSGGKVSFNFQYASGNNNGTSVEDGQIPEIIFLYSCS